MGVKYLGFVLKEGQQVIDTERVKVITEIPWPVKRKPQPAMRVLSSAGFCQQWIPGLGELM